MPTLRNSLKEIKRASPKSDASATVEAVCIFPFVIFFFLSIIWYTELFYIHSCVGNAVNLVGNEIVAYSYPLSLVYNGGGGNDEILEMVSDVGVTETYLRGKIKELSVYSELSGLTFVFSDFSESGAVDIAVTYYVEPYLEIPGINGVYLTNHFYSKKYTGYTGSDDTADTLVYITRTGTVYHTSPDCRVLKCTTEAVSYSSVSDMRNRDGSKYYPCEFCEKNGFGSCVYITPYGTRYHSSDSCSAIKTDIFEVPLSEVSDRRKCKFCEETD